MAALRSLIVRGFQGVRAVTAAVWVALVSAVVAGCGSGDSQHTKTDGTPAGDIRAAVENMSAAKSVHIHGSDVFDNGLPTIIDGALSFGAHPAGDVTITTPTDRGQITLGTGKNDGSTAFHLILDAPKLYVQVPRQWLAAESVKGRPDVSWVSFDATGSGPADLGFLGKLDTDPQQLFAGLSAKGNYSRLGADTVDGVTATHYSTKPPVSPTPTPTPSGSPTCTGSQSSDESSGGPGETADVWIDGRGLPVEVKVTSETDVLDVHFSGWGTSVSVTAPPAAQVLPYADKLVSAPIAIAGSTFKVSAGSLSRDCFSPSGTTIGSGTTPGPTQCFTVTLPSSRPSAVPSAVTGCFTVGGLSFAPPEK